MDGEFEDGLHVLLPVVAEWFRAVYGTPTPPQRLGWPAISAGRHSLIFAPTGSGKTLAAFLACLDHLWRTPRERPGVRLLYISPLKALNQDIARNLTGPLEGIVRTAEEAGTPLPPLSIAVRSGDTPASERQRLVRRPPDLLITTPESLHLMLTSRARETLRSVTHVIVDEIHAVCANKRGVFLALLLERLEALTPAGFVRIGLSATQRPLEEVARYLGGARAVEDNDGRVRFEPRPVTIIDTGQRKVLDIEVSSPLKQATPPPAGTIWPAIERQVLDLVQSHRSTIVFANNRRVVERMTAHLNELMTDEGLKPVAAEMDAPPEATARSHHGSLSPEERRETEDALKNGELSAVVATASLELGIDMGAVDLVCQVESPGTVARALQRVGRAGHIVGRVSKGRLIAKTAPDLIEAAALCREMTRGAVESLRVPTNCLDVLAQQVVACVAMDAWPARDLFRLVRQSYPYRDLTPEAFESVLKMISGRFPIGTFRDLRARVSWDRVHNRLAALPGTAKLALINGGTIPDTGQFPVYLGAEGPRLGELDEEFVFERRVGDTFVLGTNTWKIDAIETQRVIVSRAEGRSSLMPFWRGESTGRSAELGEAVGELSRHVLEHLDDPALLDTLRTDYHVDATAARVIRDFLVRQKKAGGAIPDDQTVLVEAFRDPTGEMGLAVLTPFGAKLHLALKLVLLGRLRQRYALSAACMHDDDGLVFRLPQTDDPPLDLFDGMTSDVAEELIRGELGDSALFGLRFRQNAARALLMPRPDPSKRTPLWLQRLRAKDLLQVVRQFPEFPIVIETYRECLDDDLDLPRLRRFLDRVQDGSIRVVQRRGEHASPLLSELLLRFQQYYIYEWDEPQARDRPGRRAEVADDLLDPLLNPGLGAHLLDPSAVHHVESRLRGVGRPPRSTEEMAEALRQLGDLSPSELVGPMQGFVRELVGAGRAVAIRFEGTREPDRWISVEDAPLYESARLEMAAECPGEALSGVVRRYLQTHALVGLDDLTARYPVSPVLAAELLERWADAGEITRVEPADGDAPPRWADGQILAEVRRMSIALRRKESVAVAPEIYADFLVRRQHVHPDTRKSGAVALDLILQQLQGFASQAELWESEILPPRLPDYRPEWLDESLASGGWSWRAEGKPEGKSEPLVTFWPRDESWVFEGSTDRVISTDSQSILQLIPSLGAVFTADLARAGGLEPSRVRRALMELARNGLVGNDRFDPLRPAAWSLADLVAGAATAVARGDLSRRKLPGRLRRNPEKVQEGRWSRLPSPTSGPAERVDLWVQCLLDRYGVLTRETVALDAWAPPWRDLVSVLSRAELRGEVRRGYFVEGLSGVQYATDEAADALARHAAERVGRDAAFLLATLDPANLYGAGAPFDIELLEGGTARLPRAAGNYLVLCGGRPVLIVEAYAKRLTGLSSASEAELQAAAALLPRLARGSRRKLRVETYNTAPALASPAAPWLEAAGFVRDYPGLAYYAGW